MQTDAVALRLERDRLERRARQIQMVSSALRERAVQRQAVMGTAPAPLRRAIADFERELVTMRRRLTALESQAR